MRTQSIKLSLLAALALFQFDAKALHQAGEYDRPILATEEHEIFYTSQDVSEVKHLELTMTQRDGEKLPTGFNVRGEINRRGQYYKFTYVLKVEEIVQDDCGSTVYYAKLRNPSEEQVLPMNVAQNSGHRVNLVLTDHSTRHCEDYKSYSWEMELREGYGFCGTQDTVIEAGSNPEPVYTIQQHLPKI